MAARGHAVGRGVVAELVDVETVLARARPLMSAWIRTPFSVLVNVTVPSTLFPCVGRQTGDRAGHVGSQ